jgi:hypothetical protein
MLASARLQTFIPYATAFMALTGLSGLVQGCDAGPTRSEAGGASTSEAGSRQKPTCREAWASVPPARRSYDFSADAASTPRGNEGYGGFAARLARAGCRKAWTVLIYMAADVPDELRNAALWQIGEMEAPEPLQPGLSSASSEDADVLVSLDLPGSTGIRYLHLFRAPDAPRRPLEAYRNLGPEVLKSPITTFVETEDIPAGESLRRFLDWGLSAYPADRVMAVIWGHGNGFRGLRARESFSPDGGLPRSGVAADISQRTVLDIPTVHDVLAGVARERLGRPFDVAAFDACMMQSIEVATEIADSARYVVGSQQKETWYGLPYRELLPHLNGTAGPLPRIARCDAADQACAVSASLPAIAQRSVGGLTGAWAEQWSESFTLSAVETEALKGALVPAMRTLSAALFAYEQEKGEHQHEGVLSSLLALSCGPTNATICVPSFDGGARDLGVFLTRLERAVREDVEVDAALAGADAGISKRSADLLDAITTVRRALARTVVAASFGKRYAEPLHAGMSGLSVWLPLMPQEYESRIDDFETSRLYRALIDVEGGTPASMRAWLGPVFGESDRL